MKLGLGDDKVLVLDRLRLRAAEIVTQRTRHVAALDEHAEFPVRNVVQPDRRRHDVVGQVAAALVHQGFHRGDHGARGIAAGGQARLGLGRVQDRGFDHVEGVGFVAPVYADQHQQKQQDRNWRQVPLRLSVARSASGPLAAPEPVVHQMFHILESMSVSCHIARHYSRSAQSDKASRAR